MLRGATLAVLKREQNREIWEQKQQPEKERLKGIYRKEIELADNRSNYYKNKLKALDDE
jgi:hypothetical protein